MIDEIYEEISLSTPLDFANGLAGIGWGIEYLVQNHFIEADPDEVLEEIDKRLMSLIYSFHPSISLCEGVIGSGAYLLKRIRNPATNDEKLQTLINKQLLVHVISELDRRTQDVSNLIREPSLEQHDTETSQKAGTPAPERERTAIFDLTWDYPLLLAFLTEVFHLHLYDVRIIGILKRLILPILKAENHPQLHSNRLLLTLALTKLKYENINSLLYEEPDEWKPSADTGGYAVVEPIITSLLSGINRVAIAKELSPDCAFLRNGTMGIAWLYRELFNLSGNNVLFGMEAEYWTNESFKLKETEQGYAGFNVVRGNEGEACGLLNGLAGISLNLINQHCPIIYLSHDQPLLCHK
ncbi:MAG: hypothetical protein AB2L24_02430 [Mangrovibacterium sp.]